MSKSKQHLVPVKKIITRGGKTFETTVLINPNKMKTVKESNKKVNVPLDKWDSISSLEDFDKYRKEIFANKDVSTKDALKNEFVEYFASKGIKFKRCNTNSGVDYMRCMMAVKKAIANGDFSAGKKKEQKFKEMSTEDAKKLIEKTKKTLSRDMLDNLIKTHLNPQLTKTGNKGVDHMRCMMALREALEEGKDVGFIMDTEREKNPNYNKNKTKSKAKPKAKKEKKPKELNRKQRHAQWMKQDKEDFLAHLKDSDAQQRVKDDKDDYKDEIDEFTKNIDHAIKWDYDIDNIVFSFMKNETEDAYGEEIYAFDIEVSYDIDGETNYNTLHTVYDFDTAAKICRQLKAKYSNKFKGTTTGVYNGKESFEVAAYNYIDGLDDPNDNKSGKK